MIDKEQKMYRYCIYNDIENIKKLLEQEKSFDLTYSDGLYFKIAIKHENANLFAILLEYYKQTKLQGYTSQEQQNSLEEIRKICLDASQMFDIPNEIQGIIDDYININDARYINKNYPYAYRDILDQSKLLINKAENTPFLDEIKEIVALPQNLLDINAAYNSLKDLQNNLSQMIQEVQDEIEEKKLSEKELFLKILKWAIEGCQMSIDPFLKDIESQFPNLLVDYNNNQNTKTSHESKNKFEDRDFKGDTVSKVAGNRFFQEKDNNFKENKITAGKDYHYAYKYIVELVEKILCYTEKTPYLKQIKQISVPQNSFNVNNIESYTDLENLQNNLKKLQEEINTVQKEEPNEKDLTLKILDYMVESCQLSLNTFLIEIQHIAELKDSSLLDQNNHKKIILDPLELLKTSNTKETYTSPLEISDLLYTRDVSMSQNIKYSKLELGAIEKESYEIESEKTQPQINTALAKRNAFNQRVNDKYQYQAEDITIIQKQLMRDYRDWNIYRPIEKADHLDQVLEEAQDTFALILCIYNTGLSHWTVLALLYNDNTKIALYKDSLGQTNEVLSNKLANLGITRFMHSETNEQNNDNAASGIFALENMKIMAREIKNDKESFIENFSTYEKFCTLHQAEDERYHLGEMYLAGKYIAIQEEKEIVEFSEFLGALNVEEEDAKGYEFVKILYTELKQDTDNKVLIEDDHTETTASACEFEIISNKEEEAPILQEIDYSSDTSI